MRSKEIERIKNILVNDKQHLSVKISSILKSDLYNLLNSYFEIRESNVNCDVKAKDGIYEISFKASASRVKNFIVLD